MKKKEETNNKEKLKSLKNMVNYLNSSLFENIVIKDYNKKVRKRKK